MEKIIRATSGPKHHLFGFHDLVAFNATGEKLLSLEADTINRPPLPNEEFGVGYVYWQEQRFVELGKTCAMNYPQGSRQQWLDNEHFIVNNRVNSHWGADIYDVVSGQKEYSIDSTCHILSLDKKTAFGINYSRLYRLGGYGYVGLQDTTANEEKPINDGIFKTDIATNKTELLVSIADVANCDMGTSVNNGFHHFVTHLVLSPDGKRIAFLHRCFLSDGGIRTRLMTVGVDGMELRSLAMGFLSHFDWIDNKHIAIWGRCGGNLDAVRSNPLFANPLVKPFLGIAKTSLRRLFSRSKGLSSSFMVIEDSCEKKIITIAQGIITEDGHPMFCPKNRKIMICDTYPDKETKHRTLFFYDVEKNERTDIGQFFMGNEPVDMTMANECIKDIDSKVVSMMTPSLLCFTRSGLHCDLHPRWDNMGKMVAFDSIHEGSRQIYICKTKDVLSS